MNNPQKKLDHVALAQAIKDSQETFLLRLEVFAAVAAEMKTPNGRNEAPAAPLAAGRLD